MIYVHFRATGAHEAVQGLSDLFNFSRTAWWSSGFRHKTGPSSISSKWNTCGTGAGGFIQVKVTGFRSALHCIGYVWTREPPSYSRLKTMVRRHIDQTMRTRNLRAWNEKVETGTVTKSQKWREVSVERSGRILPPVERLDNVRKETHVVSVMIQRLETDAMRDKKDNRLLLHQKRRHRLTERSHQKVHTSEGKVLLEQEAELRAESSSVGKWTNPSCSFWDPPECLNYKSESGYTDGDRWRFRLVEADGQPSKVEEKCGKGSVALLKESNAIGLCVSKLPSEKGYSTERRKIGIESHRQSLQGNVAPHQNSGKWGSIVRSCSKVWTSWAQPVSSQIWGEDTRRNRRPLRKFQTNENS